MTTRTFCPSCGKHVVLPHRCRGSRPVQARRPDDWPALVQAARDAAHTDAHPIHPDQLPLPLHFTRQDDRE